MAMTSKKQSMKDCVGMEWTVEDQLDITGFSFLCDATEQIREAIPVVREDPVPPTALICEASAHSMKLSFIRNRQLQAVFVVSDLHRPSGSMQGTVFAWKDEKECKYNKVLPNVSHAAVIMDIMLLLKKNHHKLLNSVYCAGYLFPQGGDSELLNKPVILMDQLNVVDELKRVQHLAPL